MKAERYLNEEATIKKGVDALRQGVGAGRSDAFFKHSPRTPPGKRQTSSGVAKDAG